ncbi:hypothetical protein I4641_18210 [Waterburya agarophytonicola K14]|uniref:Uncharacterized protein n=1 Tax=Waterburya agarophytonicola KI4 TaxID=2874699 RepID=A0A964BSY7_9CYAN|nr:MULTISPECIES: hypothetical protein [Hyellaceae]MCC0178905.1 hypothetical protein [Waterburya agarophytonicola KI4]
MSDKVPVVFEGKEYPIDAAIAADDDKLRQVLSPFIPAAANAKIQRESGQPIQIIKQAGTKG